MESRTKNDFWSPEDKQSFHRLIIEHKKDLAKVSKSMPNKNMGDVLQYYLASYKSSRSYAVFKGLRIAERERVEREEEVELMRGDGNNEFCSICDDGGDLVCCEVSFFFSFFLVLSSFDASLPHALAVLSLTNN